MAVNLPSKTNQMHRNIINTTLINPEKHWVLHDVKDIFRKKNNIKACSHSILRAKMNSASVPHSHKICGKRMTTTLPTSTNCITSYDQLNYSYPLISEWSQFQSPLLTVPIPVIIPTPTPVFASNICPYASSLFQPIVSPIVQAYLPENLSIVSYCAEHVSNYHVENYSEHIGNLFSNQVFYGSEVIVTEIEDANSANSRNKEFETINISDRITRDDLIEVYLSLPKDLFPPARTFTLDPNPIIDEFCKMTNVQLHTPWLLDLEFGIPNSPITRPIPIYNVKFNSIHCKNAPDAIHPSFEACDPNFKRVLLFYYDCIVSTWYRGYISMNFDSSVENFQSWLLLPMLVLGMCWP